MKLTKLIISAMLLLMFCAAGYGQSASQNNDEAGISRTDLETFEEQYGKVIIKGYTRIGGINGAGGRFEIQVREAKNPLNNSKVKGLLLTISEPGDKRSDAVRSFVEYDELDGLIKGVEYIGRLDRPVTTLQSFEATYKTKDDFKVSVFNNNNGDLQVVLAVGSIEPKSIFAPIAILTDLTSKLQQAKTILDELK